MSCDKYGPFVEMYELSLAHHCEPSCSSRLPLICPNMTEHESIRKQSLFSKFIYHRHHVFPTAYCVSRPNTNKSVVASYDENEEERDLRLPGIRLKSRGDPTTKTVGEFEINQLMASESGWDRVKYMYRIKAGLFEDEATNVLNIMFYRTAMIGFFVSAMIESVKEDRAEKNLSKTDTMKKGNPSRIILPQKIFKAALKDTLKLSILSLSLLHLSQTISAYKNKSSVWEYTLSSAIGFGALGLTHGPYKFGVFTVGGAIFGTVSGWLVCQILQSSDLTQESRSMKRMQQRAEKLRLQVETDE